MTFHHEFFWRCCSSLSVASRRESLICKTLVRFFFSSFLINNHFLRFPLLDTSRASMMLHPCSVSSSLYFGIFNFLIRLKEQNHTQVISAQSPLSPPPSPARSAVSGASVTVTSHRLVQFVSAPSWRRCNSLPCQLYIVDVINEKPPSHEA